MTAFALDLYADFNPEHIDLGLHTDKRQIVRRRGELDYAFLNRVVVGHGWQLGDQLELRVDGGHLANAEIISGAVDRVATLAEPSPLLKSLTQSMMFFRFGSLTLIETADGLTPTELRVACRRDRDEADEVFEARIKRQVIHPMMKRYPNLLLRTFTAIDDGGRSTTHIVMTLR